MGVDFMFWTAVHKKYNFTEEKTNKVEETLSVVLYSKHAGRSFWAAVAQLA